MSIPLRQKKYQPFGDLLITFRDHENYTDYKRELDLEEGLCRTFYKTGGHTYTREYFASWPDKTIVINLASSGKKALSFDITLTSDHNKYTVSQYRNDILKLTVNVSDGVLNGTSMVKAAIKGGKINATGDKIHVEKADKATIWLSAATNFVNPSDVSGNPNEISEMYLETASQQNYRKLKKKHLNDYQYYFNRFSINLGVSGKEDLPTDKRILKVSEAMDNSLAALYVQYGRYLMLSSSRPGTYPANLQGIWNDKLDPAWDSKYTVNINTEMNYWPVEILNIEECHEALFKMIKEIVLYGEKVANNHYRARGWVLHHNTDLWRGAAPINASNHGIWVTGSGWMAHHFWEHFLYGRDSTFLHDVAWPVMKGAAMFYVDFLVPDPESGWLVSVPSNSPENGGLVSGPTMDHQIIRSLFKACISASEILDVDKEFADTLSQKLALIAPYKIGRFGQLQEWMEDIDDPDNKHRHVSHLWGVYPGREINWIENPELMEAAKISLIARGDEGTGWSLAWKINFWARFRDGNHAWKMVQMLLRPEGRSKSETTGGGSAGGGSYPNLFDAHPPFQIDGNFGGAAGIMEILMQSHLDGIDILPALPDEIPDGHIKGVRARGGFTLEFTWSKGILCELMVRSDAGLPLSLRYGNYHFDTETAKGDEFIFDGNLNLISD
jgi:alpha-L-fucosidase 2